MDRRGLSFSICPDLFGHVSCRTHICLPCALSTGVGSPESTLPYPTVLSQGDREGSDHTGSQMASLFHSQGQRMETQERKSWKFQGLEVAIATASLLMLSGHADMVVMMSLCWLCMEAMWATLGWCSVAHVLGHK